MAYQIWYAILEISWKHPEGKIQDKEGIYSFMEKLKKIGNVIFTIYFDIGVVAMALLAVSVFFTVIARYFFSLSWKEVSEFNVTLFAFTTFWGMGVNVIKNEHVIIDFLFNKFSPKMKRIMSVVDYLIVLFVDLIFTYQGVLYVNMAGKQISQGMEIPMKYMYGIMPLSGGICAVCIVIKLIEFITCDISYFENKD